MFVGNIPMEEESERRGSQVSTQSKRCCWVCFVAEDEDEGADWVQPCRCRGTTKWVHQACLQRWVDEKESAGMGKITCPQCQTEYIIVFPHMGHFVLLLDAIDEFILKVTLFLSAGIAASAIYWSSVTYGALTIMQVLGQRQAVDIMDRSDPFVLLLGLPSIPIALVAGRLVSWEDFLLKVIWSYMRLLPFMRNIVPYREPSAANNVPFPMARPISATRILCGALSLPTFASLLGNSFYKSMNSRFLQTVCGGLTFIATKGVLRIYHKQKQYIRHSQRKILDYTESNIAIYNNQAN